MKSPFLSVTKLSKTYKNVDAVKQVSFSVQPGEVFALIGPNGAGKSTTLRVIATLLSPSSGEVSVGDFDVVKQSDRVREVISYLPEEAGAYRNLKGTAYLRLMAALYTNDAKQQKEYVAFASKLTDLGSRLDDKIATYSKGMTRKILLARTVMSRPKLAILDEPTSGLDVINAFAIRQTIKDLAKNGMTVLLSSHNMLEIEYLSDRVAIINKGEILATGTPDELKKQYKAQNLEEVFISLVKPGERS